MRNRGNVTGRVVRAARTHPSAVLLCGQLLTVLAYPFLEGSDAGQAVLSVVQMVVVGVAVWAVRSTSALGWVAALLGGPAVVLGVVEATVSEADGVVVASACFHVPFYLFTSYALLRYLFHDDIVTRDELFATGAAFTVVAWAFAYVYDACQALSPGSFVGSCGPERSWFELLYLSFSTLTSVGLSDVAPVLPHARSLVMLEMVAGVFYVALVVARLVGHRRHPAPLGAGYLGLRARPALVVALLPPRRAALTEGHLRGLDAVARPPLLRGALRPPHVAPPRHQHPLQLRATLLGDVGVGGPPPAAVDHEVAAVGRALGLAHPASSHPAGRSFLGRPPTTSR